MVHLQTAAAELDVYLCWMESDAGAPHHLVQTFDYDTGAAGVQSGVQHPPFDGELSPHMVQMPDHQINAAVVYTGL